MNIDHVTLAAPELQAMEQAFTALGLKPEYGGPHSNGITHMALLGFEDGSYIELISTLQPGQHAPWWGQPITENAGPCSWAVATNNIQDESARIASAGIRIDGPRSMNRQRPDGQRVEWELTYLGDHEPGATLPFLIEDQTPRELRVRPTPGLKEKGLTGVARVVLAVRNLDAATDLYRRAFGWPAPQIVANAAFGATLAHFADTPVILASPHGESWLTTRLAQFGDLPCAYLLGTPDLPAATANFGLVQASTWFGRSIAWFDPQRVNGARVGCIG